MKQFRKNTRTQYEFTFTKDGQTVFTLWFIERKPTLNRVYRLLSANKAEIMEACKCEEISGYPEVKAGDCVGKMTGRTLLQARGYAS